MTKDVRDELDFTSDTLSTRARATSAGILVLVWGLLTSDSWAAQSVIGQYGKQLILTGGLAILTLLFDFLQYIVGYIRARILLNGEHRSIYVLRWIREAFFVLKLVVLLFASVLLLYVLAHWLAGPASV
jgi:hypothetical protein